MRTKIFSALVFSFLFATAQSQELKPYITYKIKYKHGMTNKAMELGMTYFQKAHEQAGIHSEVYQYVTGPWDAQIIVPLKSNDTLEKSLFKGNPEVWQNIISLAGGEEKAGEVITQFNEMVLIQEYEIMKKVSG